MSLADPRTLLTLLLLPLAAAPVHRRPPPDHASQHYVAPVPRGAPGGDGSRARPWDLATALAGADGRVQPNDTVWLTNGRYAGSFHTQLRGEPGRLIVFRQERGSRATVDGTLRADGAYLAFWGFEIMQSNPLTGGYGLEARTNGGKFINLVIHDAGTMGVSYWTPGEDAELYGCVVYNNGTHENLDHGVYVHNERGTKRLADNVFFNNLAYGIHAYAGPGNAPQHNISVQGNIAFNNGTISRRYRAKGNILVGGDVPMSGIEVSSNLLYFSGTDGVNLRLGYAPVSNDDVIARGNFMWGGATALWLGQWQRAQVDGNTLGGASQLLAGAATPFERTNLTYPMPRIPSTAAVFVRPNRYERGRAYIVAYNFPRQAELKADVADVLNPGDAYELRSVQDPFGPPLARGTYAGDSLPLPMSEPVSPALPIGRPTATPPTTRPLFDVFLLTLSGAAAPSGTH